MQAPQSLEELESAIKSALEKSQGHVQLTCRASNEMVHEAAKELVAAIREAQESGAPLTPCQRLAGEAIITHVQQVHQVSWEEPEHEKPAGS